jgi:hypothetical protein
MIIHKSQFKYQKKYRGKWPFTVDQVAVVRLQYDGINFFALVHNYHAFALSFGLEKMGFTPLVQSGILKGGISPFFDFINNQIKQIDGGGDEIS